MRRALLALTAALSLAALPAAAAPQGRCGEGYEPSAPVYDVIAERDRYVRLPDGTAIQVDVYRPDAEGAFPALVWFDVYWKDDQNAVVNDERDYFVERGYAFVHASSPGSNNSGGSYENAFGPQEQEAAAAVVDWAGEQPWSTGEVGMDGLSYAAIIQFFVGAQQPEHLTTLYPAAAYTDLYRDIVYTGGNLQAGYPVVWDAKNRSPAYLPPTSLGPEPATDVANYATSVAGWRPIAADFVQRPYDDDFYRIRSPRWSNANITVPFALDVGWFDDMLYGGPINYETVGSRDKRMVIGPWGHSESHRREGGRHERLRWYDHHLKGLPSGVDCDPPVRVFVMDGGRRDVGYWRESPTWPLPGVRHRELFLAPGGGLSAAVPMTAATASYRYVPGRSQTGWEGVAFQTAPLPADVEVVGYSELVLWASTDQPDTAFSVHLEDVAPDGTRTRLQSGWLRAAARELDPQRSEPGRPFQRFERDLTVPAGEPVEYRVPIWPTASTFRAGHRIRVVVDDKATGSGGAPFVNPPHAGTNVVHIGPATPSRLVVPVAPPAADPE